MPRFAFKTPVPAGPEPWQVEPSAERVHVHDGARRALASTAPRGIIPMRLREFKGVVLRQDPEDDEPTEGGQQGGCGDGDGCGRQ